MRLLPAWSTMLPAVSFLAVLSGCSPVQLDDETSADLTRVPAQIRVNGRTYDVEEEYLPRVVMCENNGGNDEALKAQAIASRTYLAYMTRGQAVPTIGTGENFQVFACGKAVSSDVKAAVDATRGQIILHNGAVICAFYAAGAPRNDACQRTSWDRTEAGITPENVGLTGSKVHPSSMGSRSDPANRGAMGQLLENCIAARDHLSAAQVLAHFYGADIEIKGAGPAPAVPTPAANDPAAAPPADDSMSSPTPDPTAPTTDPTAPAATGPSAPQPDSCWSFTLQRWVARGVCVQSTTDQNWYQCDPASSPPFVGPVDTTSQTGPLGACVS